MRTIPTSRFKSLSNERRIVSRVRPCASGGISQQAKVFSLISNMLKIISRDWKFSPWSSRCPRSQSLIPDEVGSGKSPRLLRTSVVLLPSTPKLNKLQLVNLKQTSSVRDCLRWTWHGTNDKRPHPHLQFQCNIDS